MTAETRPFQAEVRELLDLVIHSLYSHEEVFLRELVSNASDALEKLRFEALTRSDLVPEGHRAFIRLEVDRDARLLRVVDTGVGMSRDELVGSLGTIASSGTRRFLEAARAKGAPGLPELIGQFGVGFYASFIVASEVVVETRRAGEAGGTRWRSDGTGEFTLEELADDDPPSFGTRITLHLRDARAEGDDGEEGLDFTDPRVLRALVRRYSDFVEFPIEMDAGLFEGDDVRVEEREGPGGVERVAVLNTQKPLWARPRDDVRAEEHAEFFRHLTHEGGEPLETIHFKAEGATEYTALLYVPAEPAFDPFGEHRDRSRIALYVRRVLVMADCDALLPPWLRFVRGIVDSADLPLNVSREVLQANRLVRPIAKRLTKKVLDALRGLLTERRADYERFFAGFGAVLKEGLVTAPEFADDVAAIALFPSSRGESPVTLDEYVAAMPEGQDAIYTLRAADRESAARSPHAEALRARGFEVLFLVDPIDEWVAERLTEHGGHPLRAVDRGEADFESEERREERERAEREHRDLLARLEELLKDDVARVRFSGRLAESAAVLVDEEGALGRHMERAMRHAGAPVPERRRALELNADHPLVARLAGLFAEDPRSQRLADYAHLVLGQAQLAEGTPVRDPVRFGRLVADLMVAGGG